MVETKSDFGGAILHAAKREGVSVVIPLFNKEATLARAIASIKAQDYSFEIVVVDDGSTDRSAEVARSFGAPVKVVVQDNTGPSSARNNGVDHASYDWICFLDADDELAPGALKQHMETLALWPGCELSLSSFAEQGGGRETTYTRLADRLSGGAAGGSMLLTEFRFSYVIGNVASCVISRNLFEKVHGFDNRLRCWELTDFFCRAMLAARNVALPSGIQVIKHDDGLNSQYYRTNHQPEYADLLGNRLVDLLPRLPLADYASAVRQVSNFAHILWQSGWPESGVRLLARARQACPTSRVVAELEMKMRFRLLLKKLFFRRAGEPLRGRAQG